MLIKTLIRYGWTGAFNALLYIGLTVAFAELANFSPLHASISGFTVTLPLAYVGHRYFAFQSDAPHLRAIFLFAVTMSAAFVVSTVSVLLLVEWSGFHYAVALLMTTVLGPMVNFLILRFWVFRPRPEHEN